MKEGFRVSDLKNKRWWNVEKPRSGARIEPTAQAVGTGSD
jgi:hypothetical protein